jgi:hypothetical protein
MSQIEEDSLPTFAEPSSILDFFTKKLETRGLEQSKFDPCLFVGTKVICVVHINDLIFWSKYKLLINDSAIQLHELGVNLKQEDDAVCFLKVTLEQDSETGLLEMKQTRLIKDLIEALVLDNGANGKFAPL